MAELREELVARGAGAVRRLKAEMKKALVQLGANVCVMPALHERAAGELNDDADALRPS